MTKRIIVNAKGQRISIPEKLYVALRNKLCGTHRFFCDSSAYTGRFTTGDIISVVLHQSWQEILRDPTRSLAPVDFFEGDDGQKIHKLHITRVAILNQDIYRRDNLSDAMQLVGYYPNGQCSIVRPFRGRSDASTIIVKHCPKCSKIIRGSDTIVTN